MHAKPLVAKWVFDNIARLQVKASHISYISKAPDAPDGLNKPEQMLVQTPVQSAQL